MTGPDLLDGLHDLAALGERTARPLAPGRIRARGDRRGRRRRVGAAVGAIVGAALAGVIGIGLTERAGPGLGFPDDPVATPVVTAHPVRLLTGANLLRPADLPAREGLLAEVYESNARPGLLPTACFADGLDTLGATDVLTGGLRYRGTDPGTRSDPEDPLAGRPTFYSSAVQFADEAAAEAGYREVSGRIERCADVLTADGYVSPDGGAVGGFRRWYSVRGTVETARFTEFGYQRRDVDDGAGYWEAVGLVRVGDRVAVVVSLTYGQDSNWDTDPEAGVAGPHPLADLVPAAAEHLRR